VKLIITGAGGLLGTDLVTVLSRRHDVVPVTGRRQLDLTDLQGVFELVGRVRPDVVVHAAGWRDVDACERDPAKACRINVVSARNVSLAARRSGAAVVYISSDTVFDGTKAPYHEFSDPNPINVYGSTKLQAERVIQALTRDYYIVRMPLLFGLGGKPADNVIRRTIDRLDAGEEVRASSDQVCGPTSTVDAAEALEALIESGCYGVYHVSNAGEASVADFLMEVARQVGQDPDRIRPITSADLRRPASRPLHTTLASICLKDAIGTELRSWKPALSDLLIDLAAGRSPGR